MRLPCSKYIPNGIRTWSQHPPLLRQKHKVGRCILRQRNRLLSFPFDRLQTCVYRVFCIVLGTIPKSDIPPLCILQNSLSKAIAVVLCLQNMQKSNRRQGARRSRLLRAAASNTFAYLSSIPGLIFVSLTYPLCSHEESNLDHKLRKLTFYPLNYGSDPPGYHSIIQSQKVRSKTRPPRCAESLRQTLQPRKRSRFLKIGFDHSKRCR